MLPREVPVWMLARQAGWTCNATQRQFLAAGLLHRIFGRKGWFSSLDLLWARVPEIARRLEAMDRNGELKMSGRARSGRRGGIASAERRAREQATSSYGNGGCDLPCDQKATESDAKPRALNA